MSDTDKTQWRGTTILCVRKNGAVVIAGDGQVSMGNTVVKANACKIRRLGGGNIIAGFAGATADAFTLFERLEAKLERYPGQLARACVELARSEEHTSELQSHSFISYAVFCLKKKKR